MLDTSRRPGVPLVVFALLAWSAVEATIFAFALRPTMSELVEGLIGMTISPIALVGLLGVS